MKYQLLLAAGFLFLLLFSDAKAQELPIAFEAKMVPVEKANATHQVEVVLEIQAGWHTYDQLPEGNPSPSTSIKMSLPVGVKAVGAWERPPSVPDLSDPETLVFEGSVKFTRLVNVSKSNAEREIVVEIAYQVCNEQKCFPPKKKKLTVGVPAEKSVQPEFEFSSSYFKPPTRLTVAGKPLNHFARKMYPSPSMFDVDNDGQVELVSGDIMGSLMVYENTNADPNGEPVWDKPEKLLSKDGEEIKVKNW